jgi:hypothetical protein
MFIPILFCLLQFKKHFFYQNWQNEYTPDHTYANSHIVFLLIYDLSSSHLFPSLVDFNATHITKVPVLCWIVIVSYSGCSTKGFAIMLRDIEVICGLVR